MACTSGFTIDKAFHTRLRGIVDRGSVEHGGDSRIDYASGYILPATEQTGSFSGVQLNRGIVDWHTHPATCIDEDNCTIGLPSPSDMANVAIGAASGNQAHMVYSAEGTYVIQLNCELRRRMASDGEFTRGFPAEVNIHFERLFDKYSKKPPDFVKGAWTSLKGRAYYAKFTSEFNHLASRLGYKITFFAGNRIPSIRISYECEKMKR
jgi:hypothetical protein